MTRGTKGECLGRKTGVSWNSQDGGRMRHRRELGTTRARTTIVHTSLLCIGHPLLVYPPTGAYTLTTFLYLQARTKYNPAGGLWPQRLHQDSVCVLQMAFHLGADLLPSSIGLLVDQAHSVVVSRVHVLPGCWGQRQFLASGFYLRLLTSW